MSVQIIELCSHFRKRSLSVIFAARDLSLSVAVNDTMQSFTMVIVNISHLVRSYLMRRHLKLSDERTSNATTSEVDDEHGSERAMLEEKMKLPL